jgi:nucleoside 2-deoxyribosyltransferase
MKLYVASPFGFTEAGRFFYRTEFLPALRKAQIELIDPWTEEMTESATSCSMNEVSSGERNRLIAQNNVRGIDRCDAMLAVLDGTDVDSGTAAEIGYAFGKGKVIIGYRSDFRRAGENDATAINLQVAFFISESGGCIASTLNEVVSAIKLPVSKSLPFD